MYLSRLTNDYVQRGGRLLVGPLPATAPELAARTDQHDVVVMAAGRSAPLAAALFPAAFVRDTLQRLEV